MARALVGMDLFILFDQIIGNPSADVPAPATDPTPAVPAQAPGAQNPAPAADPISTSSSTRRR